MFNLINILGQNTLPEQVEINKQNIAILADEVEKLGYQPKGVYDAETEYNHNDVVFYDNKLYVVTSDAAIVGVLPTNTTYWQQVTGDIRGQQGATGAQGPAGADGTDGVDGADTLWYKNNILVSTLEQFTALLNEASHSFSTAYFNRTPKVGDNFMVFVYLSSAKESYWLQYQVSAVRAGSTTAVYQNSFAKLTGAKGDKGDTGKSALVYGETIPFSRGESSIQLIEQALPFANFNRTPELNEDFIAILHDTLTLKDYIANVEVQTINSGSQVVSVCVASNIALITGADGQNGTNGTDGTNGKDALVAKYPHYQSNIPVANDTFGFSQANFNRTAVIGDATTLIINCSSNNLQYMTNVIVQSADSSNARLHIVAVSQLTGAQGAGSQLYLHNINLARNDGTSEGYIKIINNSSIPYSFDTLIDYLKANFLGSTNGMSCSGWAIDSSTACSVCSAYAQNEQNFVYLRYQRNNGIPSFSAINSSNGTISDNVITL